VSKIRNGDLVSPVIDRVRAVNFLAELRNHCGGSPDGALKCQEGQRRVTKSDTTTRNECLFLLLCEHAIKNGCDPVLELAIVVIGHEHVANPVQALFAQCPPIKVKISKIRVSKALDKVLLHTTSRGDNDINLHQ